MNKKWITGYVLFPCFTIKTLEGCNDAEMTCSRFLEAVFDLFFHWFWDGAVHVTGSYCE